eukprot:TRINITY_DN27324_c0_g1_i1.p1 TRINITY_DN27324_c0_g1~~TRINITY_DN27324_c0_g1_i1.p1  ORF type:complete len:340 (+),score=57.55 TRINITY_DN27324_c0_g1_i1:49-1020(+)
MVKVLEPDGTGGALHSSKVALMGDMSLDFAPQCHWLDEYHVSQSVKPMPPCKSRGRSFSPLLTICPQKGTIWLHSGMSDSALPKLPTVLPKAPTVPLSRLVKAMSCEEFHEFLKRSGVDTGLFGKGKARPLHDLWIEVLLGEAELSLRDICSNEEEMFLTDGSLDMSVPLVQRHVRIVKIVLSAVVDEEMRYLVLLSEDDRSSLRQLVTRKLFGDETSEEGFERCLLQNFDLDPQTMKAHIITTSAESKVEYRESVAFPGVLTKYELHLFRAEVKDPHAPEMKVLGLPKGAEFSSALAAQILSRARVRRWAWSTSNDAKDLLA